MAWSSRMTGVPPRVVAAELGWVLPGGTPISWDVLLELAIRRYWASRASMIPQ